MFLKWQDYSGATHVVSGIREAVSYGSRHQSEALTLAEFYDGDDVVLHRVIGPDVWHGTVADAREFGHWAGPNNGAVSYVQQIAEDDPRVSYAVRVDCDTLMSDSDRVMIVQVADRSHGLYVIVTYDDPSRRRDHYFIDCTVAWLMNEHGVTIDRLGTA